MVPILELIEEQSVKFDLKGADLVQWDFTAECYINLMHEFAMCVSGGFDVI